MPNALETPKEINIDDFDGPLDLLLHLISEEKVDLMHLSLIRTINKYLDIIRANENSLDKLSEFVVMAATLLDLKLQLLLPDEDDKEAEEQARETVEDLKKRLIDFNKFKIVSEKLEIMLENGQNRFYRIPMDMAEPAGLSEEELEELFYGMTAEKLGEIYRSVYERHAFSIDEDKLGSHLIHKEKLSLHDAADRVVSYMRNHRECYFDEMITPSMSNAVRVAEFLVTLELAKAGVLSVYHETDENFESGRLFIRLLNIEIYSDLDLKDPEGTVVRR